MIRVKESDENKFDSIDYSNMTVGQFTNSIKNIFLNKFPNGKVPFYINDYYGGCIEFKLISRKKFDDSPLNYSTDWFHDVFSPMRFYVFSVSTITEHFLGDYEKNIQIFKTNNSAKLPNNLQIIADPSKLYVRKSLTDGKEIEFNTFEGSPYEILERFESFVKQLYKAYSEYYK